MYDDGFYIFELYEGTGTYDVSFSAQSVRVGYEDFQPIQQRPKHGDPTVDALSPE